MNMGAGVQHNKLKNKYLLKFTKFYLKTSYMHCMKNLHNTKKLK